MQGKKLYASAKTWGCKDEERAGMLLFVQRVRELLLHTTSVPAKPMTASCLTIAREIYVTLDQNARTPHPSVEPNVKQLVTEFNDALSKDATAQLTVGDRWPHLQQALQMFHDSQGQLESARYLIGRLAVVRYTKACTSSIISLIEQGGKRKEELLSLSEAFVGAIKEAGYPTQTIYHLLNVAFFDHEKKQLTARARLDGFFSNFDFEHHKYGVIFAVTDVETNVANTFASVGGEFIPTEAPSYKECVDELTVRNKTFFLQHPSEGLVKFSEISALDPQSARVLAERRLRMLDDLLRFSVHKGRFVVRNQALVKKEKSNQFVNSNRPKAPVMLVPHDSDNEHTGLANIASALRSIRGGSAERFVRAIELHGTALSAHEDESQLLNLWIALETLFVKGKNGSKIREVIDAITPYVLVSWNHYVLGELWERVQHIHQKAWAEVIEECDELAAHANINQLAVAISVPKFEPEMTKFLAQLDDDPLFRHKLFSCIKWAQKPSTIKKYLAEVKTKVAYDINRIYRTRNHIVHAGGSRTAVTDVVQLAHFYLDLALTLLSMMIGHENGVKSIDQANLETSIRSENYFSILDDASSTGTVCTTDNYSSLLFGRPLLT